MLRVTDLRLRYRTERGEVDAIRGVSFTIEQGEFYTLLGPSGCGKSSTLRCIAGLETPTEGKIEIGSSVVFSSATRTVVPVYRRDIGMVFQSYAIWPHMTVFDNVAFPLVHGLRKEPRSSVREKVLWALGLVKLDDYADRPAPLLSGGQQQRVALARALVRKPEVLLLDEPLSNLDAKLRESMRHEIKSLVRRLGITTLFVTHDQLEALSMSDAVAVMCDGRIVQEGPPRSVYLEPQSPFAANFLGKTNVLTGELTREASPDSGLRAVRTRWGTIICPVPRGTAEGTRVAVGFRPEGVGVGVMPPSGTENVLVGTVASAAFSGDAIEYRIDLGGQEIHAKGDPLTSYVEGTQVFVGIPSNRCYVLTRTQEGETSALEATGMQGPSP